MLIIDANKIQGCDYHPGFQQIAFVDTDIGELGERRLVHREAAEQFYLELKQQHLAVRAGMDAAGTRAGSSVCCATWSLSCRSEMAHQSRDTWCPSALGLCLPCSTRLPGVHVGVHELDRLSVYSLGLFRNRKVENTRGTGPRLDLDGPLWT